MRCIPRVEESHDTDAFNHLICKPCHAGRCFWHILTTFNTHVAEALLVDSKDPENAWHAKHRDKSEEPVSSTTLATRMAVAAKILDSCCPIDSKRAKAGFYDMHIHVEYALETPTGSNEVRWF